MQTAFAGSHANYLLWLAAITRTHERRIEFLVTPLGDAGEFATIRPMFLDGFITVDASRTPSRILDVTFLDPNQSVAFEPDDGETPVHRSRIIQVRWSVRVPLLGRWVTCRPFTGVIVDFDRAGPEVHLVAHGLDEQGMGQVVNGRTFPKKGSKAAALRWLAARWGETKPGIPKNLGTFPGNFSVAGKDQPWVRARKVARSVARQMFYDGRGRFIFRPSPGRPVLTIGPEALLGPVTIDRRSDFTNRWEVVGAKPKGKKQPVRAHAQLPARNPLSPQRLARNGEPLFHLDIEENTAFKTVKDCQKRADQKRDAALRTVSDYSFECLPMPHLDENDLITVRSPQGTYVVRASTWTLPLGDAPMLIGAIKRTTTRRRLAGGGGSSWKGRTR